MLDISKSLLQNGHMKYKPLELPDDGMSSRREWAVVGILCAFFALSACKLSCRLESKRTVETGSAVQQEALRQTEARMNGQLRRWGYGEIVHTGDIGEGCERRPGSFYARMFAARNLHTDKVVTGEICCKTPQQCEVLWAPR